MALTRARQRRRSRAAAVDCTSRNVPSHPSGGAAVASVFCAAAISSGDAKVATLVGGRRMKVCVTSPTGTGKTMRPSDPIGCETAGIGSDASTTDSWRASFNEQCVSTSALNGLFAAVLMMVISAIHSLVAMRFLISMRRLRSPAHPSYNAAPFGTLKVSAAASRSSSRRGDGGATGRVDAWRKLASAPTSHRSVRSTLKPAHTKSGSTTRITSGPTTMSCRTASKPESKGSRRGRGRWVAA
eukprot:3441013-Prymnesium_polylepis.1